MMNINPERMVIMVKKFIKFMSYAELEDGRIMYQNFLDGIGPNPIINTFKESTSGDLAMRNKVVIRSSRVRVYFMVVKWLGLPCDLFDENGYIKLEFTRIHIGDKPIILPIIPIEYDNIPMDSEVYIPGYKNAW